MRRQTETAILLALAIAVALNACAVPPQHPSEGRYVVRCPGHQADTVVGSKSGGNFTGAELGVFSDSLHTFTFTTQLKGCVARRIP